jgi:hypothetical protein
MLEEFLRIYYLGTQGQIPEVRNRQTRFIVFHVFPGKAFKFYFIKLDILVLFTSVYIAVYKARVKDHTVELRRMNKPFCPHIKWSYSYHYRSPHVF